MLCQKIPRPIHTYALSLKDIPLNSVRTLLAVSALFIFCLSFPLPAFAVNEVNITGTISYAYGNNSDGGASQDTTLPLNNNVLNIQSTGTVNGAAYGAQDSVSTAHTAVNNTVKIFTGGVVTGAAIGGLVNNGLTAATATGNHIIVETGGKVGYLEGGMAGTGAATAVVANSNEAVSPV
ncbi:hypothetical protein FACS189419_07970 [Planctomycetales bacterium]|nr:hypothetical protein FACS189419_07970 [Planctomycetales bacterium]